MEADAQCARLHAVGVEPFERTLAAHGCRPLAAGPALDVLQVNVGKLCNQTCGHCHVDAGPDRDEALGAEVAEQVIALLRRHPISTLDLTGGAPELNPWFRSLVREARALGRHVVDRCNLSVLLIRAQADLARFLADHQVEVVASLPSFRKHGTDGQRGDGAFERSLEGLRRLNAWGYGRGGALRLTLVHNPVGAFLPGSQASLERDYRRELRDRHGIEFDRLIAIANMPISRFLEFLERTGNVDRYLRRLVDAFNPRAADGVMCRTHLSVGWDGRLYDCDFNQMLELSPAAGAPRTLAELLAYGDLARAVRSGPHCYGCTAGAGSSCSGALAP